MTVNAFGILMQSTLPLFGETVTITDGEFAIIAALTGVAGAGALAAAGGSIWLTVAASSLGGPIAMMAVGGVVAVGCGVSAIVEGIKYNNRQKTNRESLL